MVGASHLAASFSSRATTVDSETAVARNDRIVFPDKDERWVDQHVEGTHSRRFTAASRDEFARAVSALQECFATGYSVEGHWAAGTVEIISGGSRTIYVMLASESALAFCQRLCTTEPACDGDRIHAACSLPSAPSDREG
jgi:hypothetical protein